MKEGLKMKNNKLGCKFKCLQCEILEEGVYTLADSGDKYIGKNGIPQNKFALFTKSGDKDYYEKDRIYVEYTWIKQKDGTYKSGNIVAI